MYSRGKEQLEEKVESGSEPEKVLQSARRELELQKAALKQRTSQLDELVAVMKEYVDLKKKREQRELEILDLCEKMLKE